MSTRSTTHFTDACGTIIIYRHSDGYPAGAGADLYRFFDRYSKGRTATHDASYTAAHYVVFLAEIFATTIDFKTGVRTPNPNRLDFQSVGICTDDPSDIEYRYLVDCDSGDILIHERRGWSDGASDWGTPRPFTREDAAEAERDMEERAQAYRRQMEAAR